LEKPAKEHEIICFHGDGEEKKGGKRRERANGKTRLKKFAFRCRRARLGSKKDIGARGLPLEKG